MKTQMGTSAPRGGWRNPLWLAVWLAMAVCCRGAQPPVQPTNATSAATPPPAAAAWLPEATEGPKLLKASLINTMDALDEKHKLAIGDRLSFRIVEDEEESKPLIVTDSGELELPYIGRFPAVDRTCKGLGLAIKAELEKEYYYQATVIVALDVMTRSRGKVYLAGAVRLPGPQDIPSDEVLTAGKAILRAGGFTEYANDRKFTVVRKPSQPGGNERTFDLNGADILKHGRTDRDLPLEPGDLIIVLRRKSTFGRGIPQWRTRHEKSSACAHDPAAGPG